MMEKKSDQTLPIIKLMPDYQCFPLWWGENSGKIGNIDPAELQISLELQEELENWAELYESFLNIDSPKDSPEIDQKSKNIFEMKGKELQKRLSRELEKKYRIILQI